MTVYVYNYVRPFLIMYSYQIAQALCVLLVISPILIFSYLFLRWLNS